MVCLLRYETDRTERAWMPGHGVGGPANLPPGNHACRASNGQPPAAKKGVAARALHNGVYVYKAPCTGGSGYGTPTLYSLELLLQH